MRRSGSLITLLALALSACADAPAGPASEVDGLRLTGQISQTVVAVGTTATITYRLQNLTDVPVVLTFADRCQVHAFIAPAGERADPRNAGCFAPGAPLHLPPFGEQRMTELVRGGAPTIMIYPGVPLERGQYRAYAVLDSANDRHLRLRSPDVVFTVR